MKKDKNFRKFDAKKPKKLTLDIYNRTVKFFLFLFEKKLHKNIKSKYYDSRDSYDFIIAMKNLGYEHKDIEHLLFGKKSLTIEGKIMKPANEAIKEEMLKICRQFYPSKDFSIEFVYIDINDFLFSYRVHIFEKSEFIEEPFIDIFKESLDNLEVYLKTNIFKL
jgi:hypothetical protein